MAAALDPTGVPVRDLTPASALPAAYYTFAHAGFLLAMVALLVDPSIPGASFYHPRMVALVHVVTLGWITGSILGSFYVVGPLALRVPLPVRLGDWLMFGAYVSATGLMVVSFWSVRYDAAGWGAALAIVPVLWVGVRSGRALHRSPVPAGIKCHVALAFANMTVAAAAGLLLAFDRTRGILTVSPLALVFAHAHVAAIGWGAMMVVGLAYRLIPMFLPSAMPAGAAIVRSAVLIEAGLIVLVSGLLAVPGLEPVGALLVLAGLWSFSSLMRASVKRRMPRPPALPARDWSTWQAHVALVWLLLASVLGLVLAVGAPTGYRLPLMWLYGMAGLVGFLAQIVTGIQGRLVPFYAWYRAMARAGGPPERGANSLPSPAFARPIFVAWTAGVPLLAAGLAFQGEIVIRAGALCLAAGLCIGAAYLRHMLAAARGPVESGASELVKHTTHGHDRTGPHTTSSTNGH